MAPVFLMGIDIGTTGCKTILVDDRGAVVARALEDYPFYSPKHGWAEQNPADWWDAVKKTIRAITAEHRDKIGDLKGIGLSGQMHGLVPLDKSMEVIRPAILWNDQRTEKQCTHVYEKSGGIEGLLGYTNNRMLPGYTGGKVLWLRDEEPENFERIVKFVNPKDYIRFCLTGEIATEVSDASGTGFFDVKQRRWSTDLLELLELPAAWLPECFEATEVSGKVKPDVASSLGLSENLPVVGGGGDSVIQTLGTGVTESNVLMTTLGTAGIISTALETFRDNPEGKLQVFCNVMPDTWHAMGVTLAAGGSMRWARDTFGGPESLVAEELYKDPYTVISDTTSQVPPGSKGLIFLPYLQGERCPHTDPYARGAFIGLSSAMKKRTLFRSIMEGVIYSFRDVAELFHQIGMEYEYIATSGGGAQSPVWRQIHADIFNKRVITVSGSREGAAYGAVLVAGVGLGVWKDFQTATANLQIETETEPDERNIGLYDRCFSIYQRYYQLLKESFRELEQ